MVVVLMQEAAEAYKAVMGEVGTALLTAGGMLLSSGNAQELGPGGRWEDNALMVADAMASFGGEHLAMIPDPKHRTIFLQQVCIYQHCPKVHLTAWQT